MNLHLLVKYILCSSFFLCECMHSHSVLSDPLWSHGTLYIPPSSSLHGIFQTRILKRVGISFSRDSSPPKHYSRISCISHIGRQTLYHCATWEVPLVSSYVCFNFLSGFTPCIIPFNLLVSLYGFFNVKLSCFSNHVSEFRIATRAFFFFFLVCKFSVITKSHEIRIALKL